MGAIRVSAREGYALWADTWDATPSPIVALEQRALLPWIARLHSRRAIDVGSGTGRWTARLSAIGVDASPAMLAVAAGKPGLRGRLAAADATALPIASGPADLVLCALTLGHIRDQAAAMHEFARILAPGGTLLLTDFPPAAATVQAARDMGLRSLSFLAADLSSSAFNRPVEWPAERQSSVAPELAELDCEMASLIAGYPADGFILEAPQKLRRMVAHFRAHYGLAPHIAPRCNAPWVSAVVESNGDVRPCFFHAAIGNTAGTTLGAVLNGPQAIAFRESLRVADNPICQRCVCSLYVETQEPTQ